MLAPVAMADSSLPSVTLLGENTLAVPLQYHFIPSTKKAMSVLFEWGREVMNVFWTGYGVFFSVGP